MRWRSDPPIVLRQTGPRRVHLVQAAGGPLGGDDLMLDVHLSAGSSLQLRSTAATVVQPGRCAAARWTVGADLADGAVLDWRPEPTVICDGAELRSSITISVHRGARALLREMVVLGRTGQRGGCFRGVLTIECDDAPVLTHTLLLDGADPVLTGSAGTGGARIVGMLAVVGQGIDRPALGAGEQPGLRWACSELDGPGCILLAVGDRATDVGRILDEAALDWSEFGSPPWPMSCVRRRGSVGENPVRPVRRSGLARGAPGPG